MKINVIDHPAIQNQLTLMRNKNSDSILFRNCLKCLSNFMCYDVTKDLETKNVEIETPLSKGIFQRNKDKVVLIPILRAGLGMVDGFKEMLPFARIGHLGLFRNEKTKHPVVYYEKFPESIKDSVVIILDPMLATGNSAIDAIKIVKKYKPKKIKFVCVVSCPEGIKNLKAKHLDIELYTASIDKKLNKDKYIVPGLGDAGDRIFGTK